MPQVVGIESRNTRREDKLFGVGKSEQFDVNDFVPGVERREYEAFLLITRFNRPELKCLLRKESVHLPIGETRGE